MRLASGQSRWVLRKGANICRPDHPEQDCPGTTVGPSPRPGTSCRGMVRPQRGTLRPGGVRSFRPGHTARLLPHCPSPTHQGTEEPARPEKHPPRREVQPPPDGGPQEASSCHPRTSYAEEEGQGWPTQVHRSLSSSCGWEGGPLPLPRNWPGAWVQPVGPRGHRRI